MAKRGTSQYKNTPSATAGLGLTAPVVQHAKVKPSVVVKPVTAKATSVKRAPAVEPTLKWLQAVQPTKPTKSPGKARTSGNYRTPR